MLHERKQSDGEKVNFNLFLLGLNCFNTFASLKIKTIKIKSTHVKPV